MALLPHLTSIIGSFFMWPCLVNQITTKNFAGSLWAKARRRRVTPQVHGSSPGPAMVVGSSPTSSTTESLAPEKSCFEEREKVNLECDVDAGHKSPVAKRFQAVNYPRTSRSHNSSHRRQFASRAALHASRLSPKPRLQRW